MANVHRMVDKFLVEYISTSKKDINGSEFAELIHQLHKAHLQGFLGLYEDRVIERIIQIFLKDH